MYELFHTKTSTKLYDVLLVYEECGIHTKLMHSHHIQVPDYYGVCGKVCLLPFRLVDVKNVYAYNCDACRHVIYTYARS